MTDNEWHEGINKQRNYLPYTEGGMEEILSKRNITMSHDDLKEKLGDVYQTITDAGFVLVPKSLRDDWIEWARLETIRKNQNEKV